jgi:hypothetical protein
MRRIVFLSAWLCVACGVTPGHPGHPGGYGDDCVQPADCAAPFSCTDAHCVLEEGPICLAGKKRCNGDIIETCSAVGDRWDIARPEDNCATACKDAVCLPAICTPEERRCDGRNILECLSNRSAFTFVQSCPGTCDDTTHTCAP